MRKTLWTPALLLAATAAVSVSTMLVARAQPADTTSPPPSTMPVGGMNAATIAAPTTAPTTQEAYTQISYFMGFKAGQNFKEQEMQIDLPSLNAGMTDGMSGQKPRFTEDQARAASMVVQTQMMEAQRVKNAALAEKNKAIADTFFAQNKTQADVKTTASGLQYKITTPGDGPTPGAHDVVKVNYTGKLLDGTTFDSNIPSGEPAEIPLDRVVPGWAEGLQLFKVGSKGTLWIPASLAYGDTPPEGMQPGSALSFEIELLSINPPATQPTGGMGGMPTTMPDINSMPEPMPTPVPTPGH